MRVYKAGDITIVEIDGKIFVEAKEIGGQNEKTEEKTKRKYTKKTKVEKTRRGRKGMLGQEAINTMMEEFVSGEKGAVELADEYEISTAYFYALKKKWLKQHPDKDFTRDED